MSNHRQRTCLTVIDAQASLPVNRWWFLFGVSLPKTAPVADVEKLAGDDPAGYQTAEAQAGSHAVRLNSLREPLLGEGHVDGRVGAIAEVDVKEHNVYRSGVAQEERLERVQ
ncbi:MAG: hypothetical protein WCF12_04600 [Propionicimonas sp.]